MKTIWTDLHVKVGSISVLGPIRFFWALLVDTRVTYTIIYSNGVFIYYSIYLLLLLILHGRGINENLEIICQSAIFLMLDLDGMQNLVYKYFYCVL